MIVHNNPDPCESIRYSCGDIVVVRSLGEILATLDAEGKLEGLPFMPEMAKFCGGAFRVYRRAERTCVEGVGMRRLENMVLLDGLRCNGSAHQNCQRLCLFFWKTAWLKPEGNEEQGTRNEELAKSGPSAVDSGQWAAVPAAAKRPSQCPIPNPQSPIPCPSSPVPHPSSLVPFIHPSQLPTTKGDRFYCQSTELAGASSQLPPAELRYYLRDLWIGETTWRRVIYIAWMLLVNRVWQALFERDYYRRPTGEQKPTVNIGLDLRSGELVEVKSLAEIQATLDADGRNRGLRFEAEMARYCGRRYRVATPIRTIIAEKTGKMVELSNTVILEGVACEGIGCRNCPRANYFYWRENWLKRVPESEESRRENTWTC